QPQAPEVLRRILPPHCEWMYCMLTASCSRANSGRDEHGADAEPQAEPDHPRQGARRRPPARHLAGVVERNMLPQAQVLPLLAEEPQDLVNATGIRQPVADGTVEGILADPDRVAVTAAVVEMASILYLPQLNHPWLLCLIDSAKRSICWRIWAAGK